MRSFVLVCVLCASLLAGPSSNAVDKLTDKHQAVNETHKAHKKEFTNIKEILKKTLLSEANNIFELYKEAELLFLTMQAEGEKEIMVGTSKVFKDIFK